jgi:predicted acetyltransferase
LAFLTPEQDVRPDGGMYWMARGLDLPVAVAARGFAPGISLEVAFAVEDPLVPAARGPWRLEVAGGTGKLVPAPSADIVLDARAVGPTYTGFTSPAQLAVAGLASGPPEALALLGTAFAGPHPVFFEFF